MPRSGRGAIADRGQQTAQCLAVPMGIQSRACRNEANMVTLSPARHDVPIETLRSGKWRMETPSASTGRRIGQAKICAKREQGELEPKHSSCSSLCLLEDQFLYLDLRFSRNYQPKLQVVAVPAHAPATLTRVIIVQSSCCPKRRRRWRERTDLLSTSSQ